MVDIAKGMKFLHRSNIVFRDLKPGNVLMFEPELGDSRACVAKLIDFGIATFMPPNGMSVSCGSPGYSAPEVIQLQGVKFT